MYQVGNNERNPEAMILTAIAASSSPNKRLRMSSPVWPIRSPIGWAKRRTAQTVAQVVTTHRMTAVA
jgi:hypothetical protein